jgi:hypothetical protein
MTGDLVMKDQVKKKENQTEQPNLSGGQPEGNLPPKVSTKEILLEMKRLLKKRMILKKLIAQAMEGITLH